MGDWAEEFERASEIAEMEDWIDEEENDMDKMTGEQKHELHISEAEEDMK